MRTSLFLSTLFAVSMVGGAALAEKPQGSSQEPRAVERLREHGDTVDKVYRAAPDAGARGAAQAAQSRESHAVRLAPPQARSPIDRAASRINCADSDPHCGSSQGASHAVTMADGAGGASHAARAPAFLDKVLGNDRTDINEAGIDQGMSTRAANRAWSHAGHAGGATLPMANQPQVDRKEQQYQSARVSCNEGDDCTISSKEVKKEWATQAVKAGTWQGPERREPTNAARRIAAERAAESSVAHDEKAERELSAHAGHGGGGATVAHEAEH
jgi:hypothetical protein